MNEGALGGRSPQHPVGGQFHPPATPPKGRARLWEGADAGRGPYVAQAKRKTLPTVLHCHSRESGNLMRQTRRLWQKTPAFAGMTASVGSVSTHHPRPHPRTDAPTARIVYPSLRQNLPDAKPAFS